MFNSPYKFWVGLLKHKYLFNKDLFRVTRALVSASLTWYAIVKAFLKLKEGLIFKLGKYLSLWFNL
jgi:hypothetical protein